MGKRYYWIKLQDDFFDSKRIKKLRRIAGGDTYTIIYLKMQLLAMKNEGYIKYTGLESNIAEELALDLDEDSENVKVTLQYLLSTGLCETSDDINFFLPYSVINTCSETASTQRWRDWKEKQKVLESNTSPTLCQQNANGEIEKEIEKEIDTRDRDNSKPIKHKYGEYQNVLLTDSEIEKLKAEFADYEDRIERLSSYIASKGTAYKSHYATIRNWARKEKKDGDQSGHKYEQHMFFPDER